MFRSTYSTFFVIYFLTFKAKAIAEGNTLVEGDTQKPYPRSI